MTHATRGVQPTVLLIGGADSSGGAGIARDLRTLTDESVAAALVVTAVTAQTDAIVAAIHHVPAEVIGAQIRATLASRPIGAIKIGMLGKRCSVDVVADSLASHSMIPIVIDPVCRATSGRVLLDEEGQVALTKRLLPLATLVTPNIPEAAALTGRPVAMTERESIEQVEQLLALGAANVLLKGGHAESNEAIDILSRAGQPPQYFSAARLPITMRGTGCALAAAIAANLAKQRTLEEACANAKRYLHRQLMQALVPG